MANGQIVFINSETNQWENNQQTIFISTNNVKVGEDLTLNTAGTFLDRNIFINAPIVNIKTAEISNNVEDIDSDNIIFIGFGENTKIDSGFIDKPVFIINNIQEINPIVNDDITIKNSLNLVNVSEEDASIVIPSGYNKEEKTIFFISDSAEITSKEVIDETKIKNTSFYEIDIANEKANFHNTITISGKTLSKILKSGRALKSEDFENEVSFSETVNADSSILLFTGNYISESEEE